MLSLQNQIYILYFQAASLAAISDLPWKLEGSKVSDKWKTVIEWLRSNDFLGQIPQDNERPGLLLPLLSGLCFVYMCRDFVQILMLKYILFLDGSEQCLPSIELVVWMLPSVKPICSPCSTVLVETEN